MKFDHKRDLMAQVLEIAILALSKCKSKNFDQYQIGAFKAHFHKLV